MKSVKLARIELLSMQNESPHRVLDSPGVLGQFFQKIGKHIKVEFSGKSGFFGFFRKTSKQTARPHIVSAVEVEGSNKKKIGFYDFRQTLPVLHAIARCDR